MKIAFWQTLFCLIPLLGFAQGNRDVPREIQYLVLEGGGPDQGPGGKVEENFKELAERFGAMPASSGRMLAYGVQQLRILTRSAEVVRRDVEEALDLAERTGIPVFLHVDSCYAWGADGEEKAEDGPAVKYWRHKEMREWDRFPENGTLPERIPRVWLHWGPWCSPASAAPAFGSKKFVDFASSQLDRGVLLPLTGRLKKWRAAGRGHFFAGINVAWEAHFLDYAKPSLRRAMREAGGELRATSPASAKGLRMDHDLLGKKLGYASLHWRGWNENRLVAAAKKEGITREKKFENLCHGIVRDYMASLAKICHRRGLGRHLVYTHIVALASLGETTMSHPPIRTAVNPYATPGFTMDRRGGARFDLDELLKQIREAGGEIEPRFGVVETYFRLNGRTYFRDAGECLLELEAMFEAGARVQVFYGGFPLAKRTNPPVMKALMAWLERGS